MFCIIKSMRERILIVVVGALIVVGAFGGYWLFFREPFETTPPAVGSPAPEIDLADLSGQMVSLSNLRGKVIVLSFWATWCPICTDQLKFYQSLYKRLQGEGLIVLAIATDSVTVNDVKELGLTYPVFRIIDRVSKAYGDIKDVPATFVIDKDGYIVMKLKRRFDREAFKKEIIKLLEQR